MSLKTMFKGAVLGLVAAATFAAPAAAQSLNDVLNRVRADSAALSTEDQARLREFQTQRDRQVAELSRARGEAGAVESRARTLGAEFDRNEDELVRLQTQLEAETGSFGALLGQFRQAAQEIAPAIRASIISTEMPGRDRELARIAEARRLPERAELDLLWKTMLSEMIAQGEVKTYKAQIANVAETGEGADVFRIGPFVAATQATGGTKFLQVNDQGRLKILDRQPSGRVISGMNAVINAGEGALVRGPIDPTRGDLLNLLTGVPTFNERIQQGGEVGYVIMALMTVGILLGLYKLVTTFLTSTAVAATAKSRTADNNPLGRLFKVYEDNKRANTEVLGLRLDEQILKETPKLERFNNIIKVLAAVSPLLGLLGTVVGMIIVFTQITLVGTGDPKLMAGGISTALMTTVQGLVSAIPLLLIHALCSNSSRSVQQVLEEQAAGLIAERAERERGAGA
jgi:biopolymer transport protein ExbB